MPEKHSVLIVLVQKGRKLPQHSLTNTSDTHVENLGDEVQVKLCDRINSNTKIQNCRVSHSCLFTLKKGGNHCNTL